MLSSSILSALLDPAIIYKFAISEKSVNMNPPFVAIRFIDEQYGRRDEWISAYCPTHNLIIQSSSTKLIKNENCN